MAKRQSRIVKLSVARWHGDSKHTERHSGLSIRVMAADGMSIFAEIEMSTDQFGEFIGGMGHPAQAFLVFSQMPKRSWFSVGDGKPRRRGERGK